jgi:hypothetical protein
MSFTYELNGKREALSLTIALKVAIQVTGFLPPKSHLVLLTNAFLLEN